MVYEFFLFRWAIQSSNEYTWVKTIKNVKKNYVASIADDGVYFIQNIHDSRSEHTRQFSPTKDYQFRKNIWGNKLF